jgi:uridine kinase
VTAPARETVAAVLELASRRAPTLGTGRLICIDGPAGSGKTTLAAALAEATGARVLHMDDHYQGWAGLGDAPSRIRDQVLRPLAGGRPGHYHRYDWEAGRWAERHTVTPSPLLVVEGVGSGSQELAAHCTVLVWVEADRDLRLARGLARDGQALRDQWLRWMDAEAGHFSRHRTRERADLVVDGVGRLA